MAKFKTDQTKAERIYQLQRELMNDTKAREEFHRQWKKRRDELAAEGMELPMRPAIWFIRDRWREGQREY